MDQNGFSFQVMLAERLLFNEQLTLLTAQLLFAHIDSVGTQGKLRRELESFPADNEGVVEMKRKLDALEDSAQLTYTAHQKHLKDLVARMESGHEKLEAVVAQMKKLLPPAA